MTHTYMSYARDDAGFTDLIEAELTDHGHLVWRDTSSVAEGTQWADAISRALAEAYALLVVVSQASLRSEWVRKEIADAKGSIPIIAVLLEKCDLPEDLAEAQIVSFVKVRASEGLEQLELYRPALNELLQAVDDTRPLLVALRNLEDPDDEVREDAARQLGEIGDLAASEALIQCLSDPDEDVRFAAAEALGLLQSEAALKSLIRVLDDDDADVSAAAASALGRLRLPEASQALIEQLDHLDRFVRSAAAKALGHLGSVEAVNRLIHLMRNDPISDVREAAITALGEIGGKSAEKALKRVRAESEAEN